MGALLSEKLAVIATIDPDAYATGAQSSDYINMEAVGEVIFIVMAGTLGSSATLDFKVQEATDGSGTGLQDLTGKSITQLTEAGTDSDKQAIVNVQAEELSAGFTHIKGVMTVGTATSDCGVIAIAGELSYNPASGYDLASVDEIVA